MKSGIQKVLTSMRKYLFFFLYLFFVWKVMRLLFAPFRIQLVFLFSFYLDSLRPSSSLRSSDSTTPFHQPKKNKINVNVKWRCCFYTITYKSFAFPQKIVFKTVKNFVDGKPVFFLSFTTLVPRAIYLPNRCEWKATRNCSIFYPKCWRRLCCHTRKCKGNNDRTGHTYIHTKYTSTGVQ